MTRRLAILRPEPGATATAARAEAAGFDVVRLPLFTVAPLAWTAPSLVDFDALLLTSANAVRLTGEQLAKLTSLPVLAVGQATAAAARATGLQVRLTGDAGAEAVLVSAWALGIRRALHLCGVDRTIGAGGIIARQIAVYENAALSIDAAALETLRDTTALLHSTRAAERLAAVTSPDLRTCIRVTAISAAVAAGAGAGWAAIRIATAPNDAAMLAAARD